MEQIIQDETGFEIAVVGMAGRFPGAKNLDEFWANLEAGKESIQFFSDEELAACGIDQKLLKNPDYVKAKGYLEGTDEFDASFFGYSAQEALKMDPQIRAFHECAWHTLEDAGYYPENYSGPIGLYGGGFSSSYWQQLLRTFLPGGTLDFATDLISSKDLLTTRVSYNLGLTGPSLIVNTQCSTSLVAIHLACSALISGECDMALAGGVTFILPPKTGYEYLDGFMLSPDGHCRPFDTQAGGTTWGDGVGIVALKQLRKAVKDKDQIHAIIKGSAINNDGSSKSNFTSSSVAGQADVIKLAHQFAEVNPETIEYVEAHGMGTSLGDPIEVEALKRSFNTEKRQFCGIGSVKSNIGHLMAAAGIAGFIKTILALKHKKIPPTINFNEANREINFANSPFYVNSERQDWHTSQQARRAGVSAFGIGGTNAHVVLEESLISQESQAIKQGPNILVISARSTQALRELIPSYLALASDSSIDLTALAYSSQITRKPFEHRIAIVFNDRDELIEQLKERSDQEEVHRLTTIPRVVFALSGEVIPDWPVRQVLYQEYFSFKTAFDACAALVRESHDIDLGKLAFEPGTGQRSDSREVIFAIEYSLAKWLMSFNVKPSALLSQGAGEYVAATLSGVLSLQDALRIVMKQNGHGRKAEGAMSEVRQTALSEPKIPYISRVTGSWITDQEATSPEYYGHPLLTGEALTPNIDTLRDKTNSVTIEVGISSHQLEATKSQHKYSSEQPVISTLFLPGETNEHERLLEIIGKLWVRGVPVDYKSMYGREFPPKLNLPLYPFQRERYWPAVRTIAQKEDQETEDFAGFPRPTLSVDYQAPQTDDEKELSKMWQEVLGYEKVGVLDDFLELGGDSLQGTSLLGRINKKYGSGLSISTFFQHPTIKELVTYLSGARALLPQKVIEKAPEKEYYELSSAQRRVYLLHKIAPSSLAYNMPQLVKLEGTLDTLRLAECLRKLINRHEALRTVFCEIEGRLVCKIQSQVDFELENLDGDTRVKRIVDRFVRPFNLDNAPLFRVGLGQISDTEHLLIVDMHHIIADGTSQGVLIRDFMALYSGGDLAELDLQYKDYVAWQQGERQQERLVIDQSFWQDQFSEGGVALELPTDFARPAEKGFSGATLSGWLSQEETGRLKQIGDSEGATLFMTLLAVFNVLLSKLSGQEDVTVGTPVGGRSHPEAEAMIGMFVNTLAVRNTARGSLSFSAFVHQVKQQVLSCLDHQSYPYEVLVNDLQIARDRGRNPLFDVMFTFRNFKIEELVIPGLRVSSMGNVQQDSKFDLTFTVEERQGMLYLEFEYSTELFREETIERFITYFQKVVAEVISNADQKLSEIDILSAQERHSVLYEFNDTAVDYPKDKTLVDLFEEQVKKTPDQIALLDRHQTISYRQLGEQVEKIAALLSCYLREEDQFVGVVADRSVDTVVAFLGVLKCGLAYLPIDRNYPKERINYMLEDAHATVVLTGSQVPEGVPEGCKVVDLSSAIAEGLNQKRDIRQALPTDLAYVIYTSGTTGRPKGVMVEHRSVVRLVRNTNYFPFTDQNKFLSLSNFSFDGSIFDIFGSLLNGSSLYIPTQEELLNELSDLIVAQGITVFFTTTALFNSLVDNHLKCLRNVRHILFGGEMVSVSHVRKFKETYDSIRLTHVYGPTENTTFSTYFEIEEIKEEAVTVPIGKAISNSYCYILDTYGKVQPVGVSGEICVGGEGLARGYLNNPSLTSERFIADPFIPRKTIYKTGDVGRRLPGGKMEILGRKDHQVKLRGYRIELGEIESQLTAYEGVKEAMVVIKEQQEDKYLVGYYVAEVALPVAKLRNYLIDTLPKYMIPAHYVWLKRFPLTSNGKIDREKLPDPEITPTVYVAPTNETEKALVKIWREVLHLGEDQVSIQANFFSMGGHSLKVATLVNKIAQQLQVRVPLREVFRHQDIQSLSRFLRKQDTREETRIVPTPQKAYYPLSSAQHRMYFLYEYALESLAYNMPQVMKLEGALDKEKLITAFQGLVARHESLRTSFELVDEHVVQIIHNEVDFTIEYYETEEGQTQDIVHEFIRPFDLRSASQFRVGLIKLSNQTHLLLVDMHHIISDGMSQGLLIQDFKALYQGEELSALPLQYKDYAVWQQGTEQQGRMQEQQKFWLAEFVGEVSALELPTDYPRPVERSYQGASQSLLLDQGMTMQLKTLSEQTGVTMYMLLLSVFNVLLGKLSGQEDITIGTPVAGRDHTDLSRIVGMFVNTVVVRSYPADDKTFNSFLLEVKEKVLACLDHQGYQYEELIEDLNLRRDPSRNPLFDVMFSYQHSDTAPLALPGVQLQEYASSHQVSKFDLNVSVEEVADKLHLVFEYATDLFRPETIKRYTEYFRKLLAEVIRDAYQPISKIDMLSAEERQQLLQAFNDTAVDYPQDKTIIDLFEEQVRSTPNNVAVWYGDYHLSYQELKTLSDQVAVYLQYEVGVEPGNRIGLMLEREEALLPSLFGILKAGAAYVPLSPHHPAARTQAIIANADLKALVTRGHHIATMKDKIDVDLVDLDAVGESISQQALDQPISRPKGHDLAYVIYTSGSTGTPKGVMIEHHSVVNRLLWMQKEYPITSEDVLLQKTPIIFDVSVWELFWWSFTGAGVRLLLPEEEKDPKKVIEAISKHQISIVHFVPSMLTPFLQEIEQEENDQLRSLRRVFCSGEALSVEQVATFGKTLNKAHSTQLINLYGPTEATVDVSYYPCDFTRVPTSIPIGKPIDNIKLYVLDESNGLCPIGVSGELCIEGAGLARGYMDAELLTKERFIPHPFKEGAFLYRTGDLACWLPDGNIKFLGRIDYQVKIRGFRIELGEIESQLSRYEGVSDAIVLVKERAGDKYLIGYYVSETEVSSTDLRHHLSQNLPEYMIPAHYMWLERFPLTSSGKIDRKALPNPDIKDSEEYVAPANETEEALAAIWSEVLQLSPDSISTTTSFFSLGGHSLKATTLVNKIAKQLQVRVPLKEVFRHQDIKSLSKFILSQNESAYVEISPAARQDYYPLSPAQRRMYFLYEYDPSSLAYSMPQMVKLEGTVDRNHLENIFSQLIARHEILRTSFEVVDGERVQKIHEQVDFELAYYKAAESEVQSIIQRFIRPFDLGQALQLRAGLIQLPDASHVLIVDMHHIVTDGVSQNLLIKDFMALYGEERLPAMKLQYKDYAVWQQHEARPAILEEHRKFWKQAFAEEASVLSLPTDFSRPVVKSYRGGQVAFTLDKQQYDALRKLADEVGGTMFMTVLSVFNVLLSKLSGQRDITVGAPVAGREHSDLEGVMGLFVNTLALRNKVNMMQSFRTLLAAVKRRSLACFAHQAFPYEVLIEELNVVRDTSRNPLFDVMFTYQNFEQEELVVPGLTLHPYPYSHPTAKVDLELVVVESNDELHLTFEYATDLFEAETINQWTDYFVRLVQQLTANADQSLSEVDILSEAEHEQILHAFNNTAVDYPLHKTVVELFEEQVVSSSEVIAVCNHSEQVSYTDLNEQANQLAHCLLSEGLTSEMPVVVLSERSVDMLAGVLGIFKAGGVYVPLSPAYPLSRIVQVVKDAQPGFVMTTSGLLGDEVQEALISSVPDIRVLCLDMVNDKEIPGQSSNSSVPGLSIIDRSLWQHQPVDNPPVEVAPDQLAYILYTSGSTGVPKGVMIEHRGMLNHLLAKRDTLQLTADSVVAQNASETFDISIWQFFSALLVGGKTVIYSKDRVLEPKKLLYQLHQDGVTILEVVPSYLLVLLTHLEEEDRKGLLSGLSYLLVTGETLPKKLVERWLARYPHIPMINAYGPTEASDDITQNVIAEVPQTATVPVGKVLPNLQVYVVDEYMKLCPVGVKGEVVVSGVGVGRGYLNQPAKTAAVFVTNPFASGSAERMYRTGDVGRWLADGSLEFLGRIDHQVKISGHRIELGEVESCLNSQEGVTEAVVLSRQHQDIPYLVGYYVAEGVSVDTLRNHLLNHLPGYMVPAYLVPIEAFPLTPNGKVDRKALPDSEITADQDYVAPSNETEKVLVEIWSEVLKIKQEVISVTANFFELGGHSLVATTLVNKISKRFEIECTLADIFTKQNIRAQAEYIELNGWLLTTTESSEGAVGITV